MPGEPAGSWIWYGWSILERDHRRWRSGRDRQLDVVAAGIEIHEGAGADARDITAGGPEGRQIAAVGAFVAGGAEVGHAVGRDGVDRLRDHAVLKHRLVEVADVVDDDVRAGFLQGLDVVGQCSTSLMIGRGELRGWPRVRCRGCSPASPGLRRSLPAGPSWSTSTGLLAFKSPVPYDSDRPPLY